MAIRPKDAALKIMKTWMSLKKESNFTIYTANIQLVLKDNVQYNNN